MNKETTAKRLQIILDERNMKQVDLLAKLQPYCELYGVKLNKSHLSQYLSGKNEPNQQKLFLLGQALGVSEAWLMGYDVERETKKVDLESIKEDASLDARISNDLELKEMIKKYYSLPREKQELIINLVKNM